MSDWTLDANSKQQVRAALIGLTTKIAMQDAMGAKIVDLHDDAAPILKLSRDGVALPDIPLSIPTYAAGQVTFAASIPNVMFPADFDIDSGAWSGFIASGQHQLTPASIGRENAALTISGDFVAGAIAVDVQPIVIALPDFGIAPAPAPAPGPAPTPPPATLLPAAFGSSATGKAELAASLTVTMPARTENQFSWLAVAYKNKSASHTAPTGYGVFSFQGVAADKVHADNAGAGRLVLYRSDVSTAGGGENVVVNFGANVDATAIGWTMIGDVIDFQSSNNAYDFSASPAAAVPAVIATNNNIVVHLPAMANWNRPISPPSGVTERADTSTSQSHYPSMALGTVAVNAGSTGTYGWPLTTGDYFNAFALAFGPTGTGEAPAPSPAPTPSPTPTPGPAPAPPPGSYVAKAPPGGEGNVMHWIRKDSVVVVPNKFMGMHFKWFPQSAQTPGPSPAPPYRFSDVRDHDYGGGWGQWWEYEINANGDYSQGSRSRVDYMVDYWSQRGIQVLRTIWGTPKGYSQKPDSAHKYMHNNQNRTGINWPPKTEHWGKLSNYVTETITRSGSKVWGVDLGNEGDSAWPYSAESQNFFNGAYGEQAEWHHRAAAAARAANPDIVVLGPSAVLWTTPNINGVHDLYKKILEAIPSVSGGSLRLCDTVDWETFHYYQNAARADIQIENWYVYLRMIENTTIALGVNDKPKACTEFGVLNNNFSSAEIGGMIKRTALVGAAFGLQKIYYYTSDGGQAASWDENNLSRPSSGGQAATDLDDIYEILQNLAIYRAAILKDRSVWIHGIQTDTGEHFEYRAYKVGRA